MRVLFLLLLLAPLSAAAQGLEHPGDAKYIGFPHYSLSHDLTYRSSNGVDVTTSSGTSSPFWIFGAYVVDFDVLDNGTLF